MNGELETNWESAYREAYEMARKGNPVIQAAVARVFCENDTVFIDVEDIVRLVEEAANAGFPPAVMLRGMIAGQLGLARKDEAWNDILKSAAQGCDEARCIKALYEFCRHNISLDKLQTELRTTGLSLLGGAVLLITDQFVGDMRTMEKADQFKEARIAKLIRKDALHRDKDGKMRDRLRLAEADRKSFVKKASSLSASALGQERDALRSDLEALRQRLTEAEAKVTDADLLTESKIATAVEDMKLRMDQAQFDLELALEERDDANQRADKSEHRAKAYERFIRQHGLDPMSAFAGTDGAFEQSHENVTVTI